MAVTWNGSDKSANITLSASLLTATTTSATQGAVRCTTSETTGKFYWEAELAVLGGSAYAVGWANSTASLASVMGSDKNAVAGEPTSGAVLFNNASLGSFGASLALFTVGIAFDIAGKLIWFRNDAGLWNGSLTANPATGTGGFSVSTINAGPYFPVFAANSSGASVTANFGATDYNYAAPSGFGPLAADAQAYITSSKFLGYGVLAPPQTAVSASKFLGYGVLSSPLNAISTSKFLGYAVLAPIPIASVGTHHTPYPSSPTTRRRTFDASLNLNQTIPAPAIPFRPFEQVSLYVRRRWFTEELPVNLLLYGTTQAPFIPIDFTSSYRSRQRSKEELPVNLLLYGATQAPFVPLDFASRYSRSRAIRFEHGAQIGPITASFDDIQISIVW